MADTWELGVSLYEHLPDFEAPVLNITVNPPLPYRLTEPFELRLTGISDDQEVALVAIALTTHPDSAGWVPFTTKLLGYATGPDDEGSYRFTIDPSAIRYQGEATLSAYVVDRAWNMKSQHIGWIQLAAYEEIRATCQITPTTGRAPLAVNFSAKIEGGLPPYSYKWTFDDGEYALGAAVSRTYALPGNYGAIFTIVDALHQETTCGSFVHVDPTYDAPRIDSVSKKKNPWRLLIHGANFLEGAEVFIDGVPAPSTTYRSSALIEAGSGRLLKQMVPKGKTVTVTTRNPDGQLSPSFYYRRG